MKLDSIIYDKESLAKAISDQWKADSPTFNAMYPSDTSTSLTNVFAAYGSMLQYQLISALANCYTDTAYSEDGIYQLANTLGNTLHGNISSTVKVKMTKNNLKGIDLIIPAETQFMLDGKKFFNPSAIILPASTDTVRDITLIQGEIIEINKTSTGVENERFYFSEGFKCNHNYIKLKVNKTDWNIVDSFISYDKNSVYNSDQMNVAVLVTEATGKSYIKVGNNQLGNMPASGSNINIRYVSNEGANGNISSINVDGTISTPLVFMNNQGQQLELDLTIVSTTTAYGGFSKQSIETLAYTSPYVFASGHRAIRRQDYNALLQNQCGYLTSSVWGEYEEADKEGIYDSLMMNMVYYTGLKSFQKYPFFIIDTINNSEKFESEISSTKGFWGSFSLRIRSLKNSTAFTLIQDTGAKGILFINKNEDDPRDSILPEWKNSTIDGYLIALTSSPIAEAGKGYSVGDELIVENTENEITLRVDRINLDGSVNRISLITYKASINHTASHPNPFNTKYKKIGNGSGLKINLTATPMTYSTIISTNDDRGEVPPPTQNNPITNARSDKKDYEFYQSLWKPTLQKPVQIYLKYSDIAKGIAAIKFKATDPQKGPFFETIAMFGSNIEPMPSTVNIRNSENWDHIIDRKVIENPYNNENDDWTDWIPTNCFKHKNDINGKPEFNRYKYYVIEFYSCAKDTEYSKSFVTFSKMKILYENEASFIYYDKNGKILINLPKAGDPAPNENGTDRLDKSLINSDDRFPMYGYDIKVEGITSENGYKNGNILVYIYKNLNKIINFYVEILQIDENIYKIYTDKSEILAGTEKITLKEPASLDKNIIYKSELVLENDIIPTEDRGSGYKPNDIVTINGTDDRLKLKIINVDGLGGVISAIWMNDLLIDNKKDGKFETTLIESPQGSSGSGLILTLKSVATSGEKGILGNGATISIKSNNNLQVDASFTGNRIDTQDVNDFDQPIINKYNHFTTYLEFKQPEIKQVGIKVRVKIDNNSVNSSGIVLQQIKNNINALFKITPNYIGKGIKLSDIYAAVYVIDGVSWCKVLTPLDNIEVDKNGFLVPAYIDVIEETNTFK